MSFNGKVVIITGSSAGIGQAAAYLFAKEGASLTIHGRSQEKLDKTIQLIEQHGGSRAKVLSVVGEITDPKVQKELIDKTVQKFGRIDVLINNAGIMMKPGSGPRSMENYHYVMDVNLAAPVAITELAVPHLEKTKGNVINVSSVAGVKTTPLAPFYCMSKAALDHFARNYACLLAPQGIRVNNLAPGVTESEFLTRQGWSAEAKEKLAASCAHMVPLGRIATAEEMAEYLLFLGSEKAAYMTGRILTIDGGYLLASANAITEKK